MGFLPRSGQARSQPKGWSWRIYFFQLVAPKTVRPGLVVFLNR